VVRSTAWFIFSRAPSVIRPVSSCPSANGLPPRLRQRLSPYDAPQGFAHPLALRQERVAPDGECAALVPVLRGTVWTRWRSSSEVRTVVFACDQLCDCRGGHRRNRARPNPRRSTTGGRCACQPRSLARSLSRRSVQSGRIQKPACVVRGGTPAVHLAKAVPPSSGGSCRFLVEPGLITGEKRGKWTWWQIVPERLQELQRLLGST
jgi:hypothetical protein